MPTKPKSKKDKKPTTGERVVVKHEFTVEEYRDRTQELTRTMQLVSEKEEGIKAAAAVAKAEVKHLKSRVTELANQLQNGACDVEVDALVEFNREKGVKRYFHHCPGKPEHKKFIKQEPMTESDYQLLPMPYESPAKAEPAKSEPETPSAERTKSAQ